MQYQAVNAHSCLNSKTRNLRGESFMSQNQYKCEECGAVFHTREDLEKHNRTMHSKFRCDICGETFDSEAELEAHTSVSHPQIQNSGRS